MKRRRNLVLAILLIASMVLSIGYAALTDNLTFTGNLATNENAMQEEFNQDVVFVATRTSDANKGSGTFDASADTASFIVSGLTKDTDSVTIEYDIQNQSDYLSAKVSISDNFEEGIFNTVDDEAAEYFKVEHDWVGEKILAKGETATIKITVTMKKMTAEAKTFNGAFTFGLTAVAVEPTSAGN